MTAGEPVVCLALSPPELSALADVMSREERAVTDQRAFAALASDAGTQAAHTRAADTAALVVRALAQVIGHAIVTDHADAPPALDRVAALQEIITRIARHDWIIGSAHNGQAFGWQLNVRSGMPDAEGTQHYRSVPGTFALDPVTAGLTGRRVLVPSVHDELAAVLDAIRSATGSSTSGG